MKSKIVIIPIIILCITMIGCENSTTETSLVSDVSTEVVINTEVESAISDVVEESIEEDTEEVIEEDTEEVEEDTEEVEEDTSEVSETPSTSESTSTSETEVASEEPTTPPSEATKPSEEPAPQPVAPAPEVPAPTPNNGNDFSVEVPAVEEWRVAKEYWESDSENHSHIIVHQSIITFEKREEVTTEAHTWVVGPELPRTGPDGVSFNASTYVCSVCGYDSARYVE